MAAPLQFDSMAFRLALEFHIQHSRLVPTVDIDHAAHSFAAH
jgi:hypothetical protein